MFVQRRGRKIRTDIQGFDEITGGGLPRACAVLLVGDSDSCIRLFVRQICWNILQEGGKVLYCTVDQSVEDVKSGMASHGWNVKSFEEAGKLRFVDVFSNIPAEMTNPDLKLNKAKTRVADGYYARTAMNLSSYAGFRFFPIIDFSGTPRLAVMDSLSPLLSARREDNLQLLNGLRDATRLSNATGIATIHSDAKEKTAEENVTLYADAVVEIASLDDPPSVAGLIRIAKYIGEYKPGPFSMELDNDGLRVKTTIV